MSNMSQLFLLTAPLHVRTQLALCAPYLPAATRQILHTVDCLIVNQDDEEMFCPLTIERVRTLQMELPQKPLISDMRIIVIGALELASLPAQQALLKILEEPPMHAQILLTAHSSFTLLPTIESRCVITQVQEAEPAGDNEHDQLPAALHRALETFPAPSLSLSDVMAVSEHTSDQQQAKKLLDLLMHALLHHPKYPSTPHLELLSSCRAGLEQLTQRVNTRLVIEHVLFHFVETARQIKKKEL